MKTPFTLITSNLPYFSEVNLAVYDRKKKDVPSSWKRLAIMEVPTLFSVDKPRRRVISCN